VGLTFIAIVLLAGAWAAILLPDLRNRGTAPRRNNSVKSFRQQLSGLDRTRPQGIAPRPGASSRPTAPRRDGGVRAAHARPVAPRVAGAPGSVARRLPASALDQRSSLMPRNRAEAAKRRLLTVALLAGLAVVTLLAGVFVNRTLLLGHLVVDALLAAFVYLSWERTNRSATRRSSLVTLAPEDDLESVSPLVRRAAGS
jgi:hypothetical protein